MTAATARAAVVDGAGSATVVDVPTGELHAGAVRIGVEGCGVCGSNLPVWEGRPWFSYPLAAGAPGHEAWGVVTAVGGAVDTVRIGDRVAFLSDNAFATSVDADAAGCVVLPPAISGDFPGEALGCGFNIAARSGFAPGQTVCVVGAGFLGLVVAAVAAHVGAHVIAVSRRASSLDAARALGAKDAVAFGDDVVDAVARLTHGQMCDVVVEAVGAQQPLDVASALVRTHGRLVIAGFHQDGPRTVDMQSWNWRGLDVINAHERDDAVRVAGMRAAVDAVTEGWLDPAPLYTHRFPLDRLGDALDVMRERPSGFVKSLVVMT